MRRGSGRVVPRELDVGFLGALPEGLRARLAASAHRRTVAGGSVVVAEGDPGDAVFVVAAGRLKVVHRDEELVLSVVSEGQAFGELAVLGETRRTATVIAVEDSELIVVDREDLDAALAADPAALRRLAGALALTLTRTREEVRRHNATLEARVRERTAQLRASQLEVIQRLAYAAELRDDVTGGHIGRMSRLCALLARRIGLDEHRVELILNAAPLHDVGKVGIPDRILRKPMALREDERREMQRHTVIGAELLADGRSELILLARDIALMHHERWDGLGYPNGIHGPDIPLEARICAVCDVWDALVSPRPYKAAWSFAEARAELEGLAGSALDPDLVEHFLAALPDVAAEYPRPESCGAPAPR